MRKFALTILLVAGTSVPAMAIQTIGIFGDDVASKCEVSDPGGNATIKVYVFQTSPVQPVVGSAWNLEWDAGMTMDYVSDASTFSKVGNAQDGVSIYYFVCTAGTFLIDTVTFLSHGTSSPCSYMRLGEHPTQGRSIIQCNFAATPFTPGEAIVNATAACTCNVATEPTTWGSVKALYR